MVTIRLARRDDLPLLAPIERAAGALFASVGLDEVANDEPFSEAEQERYLSRARLWVATVGDAVVAYAAASVVDGEAHLDQVSVHPDHGRKGSGAALVERVCDWGRAEGFDAITLTTYRDLAWNGPLYERLGFEVLRDDELGPELAAIRADERARGLNVQPRVAMRRGLA